MIEVGRRVGVPLFGRRHAGSLPRARRRRSRRASYDPFHGPQRLDRDGGGRRCSTRSPVPARPGATSYLAPTSAPRHRDPHAQQPACRVRRRVRRRAPRCRDVACAPRSPSSPRPSTTRSSPPPPRSTEPVAPGQALRDGSAACTVAGAADVANYVAEHDRDRCPDLRAERRRAAASPTSSTTCSPTFPPATHRSRRCSSASSSTAASRGCTSPRATAASALNPKLQKHDQRAGLRRRRARTRRTATRSATACAARRSSCGGARSRSSATCARCSPARRSGASCSPSRAPARTSPGCRRRGVKDGDEWIVNGQKVWTTLAHLVAVGPARRAHRPGGRQARRPDRVRRRHARTRRSRSGRCAR